MFSIVAVLCFVIVQDVKAFFRKRVDSTVKHFVLEIGHWTRWTAFGITLLFNMLILCEVLEESHALHVSLVMLEIATCLLELSLRHLAATRSKQTYLF